VTDAPPPSDEDTAQAGLEALAAIVDLLHGLRAHIKAKSDYAQSLHLIAEFLAKVDKDHDVAEHVGRIAMAFYDRADGINDPILARRASDKNKRDPTQKWRGRMWAALGFECLLKAKMSQRKAVEYVRQKYPSVELLLRGKRNLTYSLPRWHVQFMTDASPPAGLKSSLRVLYDGYGLGGDLPQAEYNRLAKSFLTKAAEIAESVQTKP
jgi:hypothetical protein